MSSGRTQRRRSPLVVLVRDEEIRTNVARRAGWRSGTTALGRLGEIGLVPWYRLDPFKQPLGPYSLDELQRMTATEDFYVLGEGVPDWTLASELSEFALTPPRADLDRDAQPVETAFNARRVRGRSLDEMIGVCKGILFDGVVNDREIVSFDQWVKANPTIVSEWPGNVLRDRLQQVLEDGVIDHDERRDLTELLQKIVGDKPDAATVENTATRLPLDDPAPVIMFDSKEFCLTGKFVFGPRSRCEEAIRIHGANAHKTVRRWTDYLVIGGLASRDWIHSTHGRKIEKALQMKKKGLRCSIVSEEHWAASLE